MINTLVMPSSIQIQESYFFNSLKHNEISNINHKFDSINEYGVKGSFIVVQKSNFYSIKKSFLIHPINFW